MKRKPAVAHQFYEGEKSKLEAQLNEYFVKNQEKQKAVGIVTPHAGYIYSGKVAGAVYSRLAPADVYIIIGPNHRGFGSTASVMTKGTWEMPWGEVTIDEKLSNSITKKCKMIYDDETAHEYEHSIEVQVPFLHRVSPEAKIVPVTIGFREYSPCEEIGYAIADAVEEDGKSVTIVASTDMSHYEPHEIAKKKDKPALDQILALNPKGLFDYVYKNRVSMCGVVPTVIMMIAAKKIGAKKAELVSYSTSGETSGDYHQVVGYAGMMITK